MSKPDPAPRRGNTRAHVLETARALFNETGTDRATTRAIAEAAGINEGNLYYYFRTKQALVLSLFEQFELAAAALVSDRIGSTPTDEQQRLRDWFALTWAYRFLFRDAGGLQATAPSLAPRLRRLSMHMQRNARAMLQAMGDSGYLVIDAAAQERLLANLWIVSSYWIAYLTTQRGVRRIAPRHLEWGLVQVQSLFQPYLRQTAPPLREDAPPS